MTQCHFKDLKILPSKFSTKYGTKQFHDPHSHDVDDYDSPFNETIVIRNHEENETLHFRESKK